MYFFFETLKTRMDTLNLNVGVIAYVLRLILWSQQFRWSEANWTPWKNTIQPYRPNNSGSVWQSCLYAANKYHLKIHVWILPSSSAVWTVSRVIRFFWLIMGYPGCGLAIVFVGSKNFHPREIMKIFPKIFCNLITPKNKKIREGIPICAFSC